MSGILQTQIVWRKNLEYDNNIPDKNLDRKSEKSLKQNLIAIKQNEKLQNSISEVSN